MADILTGDALSKAISGIMEERPVRCAVAFWGQGADKLFAPMQLCSQIQIVCNLLAGGTNPNVIEKLQRAGVRIRQADRLHAKVYIGNKQAIITSANASTNGLGLEGAEQSYWTEAGVSVDVDRSIDTWFETLWEESREIGEDDIKKAKSKWKDRQRTKPTIESFRFFDPENDSLPLLTWWSDYNPELQENNIIEQVGPDYQSIMDGAIDIEGKEDESIIINSCMLAWRRNRDGLPSRKQPLEWWFFSNRVVRNAHRAPWESHLRDVVIRDTTERTGPFDLNDRIFKETLRDVLERDAFKTFRTDEYDGSWFCPRITEMKNLWRALHEEYCKRI